MPRPAVCPHCSEELDIPAEFRGRQVRCAVCQRVFVPPADGSEPPPPALPAPGNWADDRPSRRPPRDEYAPPARRVRDDFDDDRGRGYRDDDDRPPPRRRKKGGTAWVWLLVLGIVGLCVLPCGGLMFLGMWVEMPNFQPHDSADGRFHAEFPGQPVSFTQPGDDGLTRQCTEYKRSLPPETYFVHYVDLRGAPQPARALKDAADKAALKVPGSSEVARTSGTHDGHPSVDLTVNHPDGTVTIARFVLAGRRLYAVGITGMDLDANENQRVSRFLDAFKVTSTAPPPPK